MRVAPSAGCAMSNDPEIVVSTDPTPAAREALPHEMAPSPNPNADGYVCTHCELWAYTRRVPGECPTRLRARLDEVERERNEAQTALEAYRTRTYSERTTVWEARGWALLDRMINAVSIMAKTPTPWPYDALHDLLNLRDAGMGLQHYLREAADDVRRMWAESKARGLPLYEVARQERDTARAEVARLTAERDEARGEAARERKRREATEAWYATRFETLRVVAEERGWWALVAAILANGYASPADPPRFAQLLTWATHRADTAEKALESIRTRTMTACAGTGLSPANAETVPEIVRVLAERLAHLTAEVERLRGVAGDVLTAWSGQPGEVQTSIRVRAAISALRAALAPKEDG